MRACECECVRASACECECVRACPGRAPRPPSGDSVPACRVREWRSSCHLCFFFYNLRLPHLPQTHVGTARPFNSFRQEEIRFTSTPRPAQEALPGALGPRPGSMLQRQRARCQRGEPRAACAPQSISERSLRRPQDSGEPWMRPGVCWEARWPAGVPNRTAL